MKKNRIGSTLDSLLHEDGILEEVDALAQKRVIAWQIEQAMAEQRINKASMAQRMGTSRTQIDRLLDPSNNKVQLDTLQRAAIAVGGALKVELIGISARGARRSRSVKPASKPAKGGGRAPGKKGERKNRSTGRASRQRSSR